jgi:hypothetical protein
MNDSEIRKQILNQSDSKFTSFQSYIKKNMALKSFLNIEFIKNLAIKHDKIFLKKLMKIKIRHIENVKHENVLEENTINEEKPDSKVEEEESNDYEIIFYFKEENLEDYFEVFENKKEKYKNNKYIIIKLKLIVTLDPTKTCFCCNVKKTSVNLKTTNIIKNYILKSYVKTKTIDDEFTGEKLTIKFFYEPPSFFNIFRDWDLDEVDQFDFTAHRENWQSRPSSLKLIILKTTALINILLEVYPKVLFSQISSKKYNYRDDPIYKDITEKLPIKELQKYVLENYNQKYSNNDEF